MGCCNLQIYEISLWWNRNIEAVRLIRYSKFTFANASALWISLLIVTGLAAHCFTNANGTPHNRTHYTIIAGKYYRNLSEVEPSAQSRKVCLNRSLDQNCVLIGFKIQNLCLLSLFNVPKYLEIIFKFTKCFETYCLVFLEIFIIYFFVVLQIKSLIIHEDYRGKMQKFRDDISLVELDMELTPTWEVQPVCVDWDNEYEDFDFIDGNNGVVCTNYL